MSGVWHIRSIYLQLNQISTMGPEQDGSEISWIDYLACKR
jgi:hypothetical protein